MHLRDAPTRRVHACLAYELQMIASSIGETETSKMGLVPALPLKKLLNEYNLIHNPPSVADEGEGDATAVAAANTGEGGAPVAEVTPPEDPSAEEKSSSLLMLDEERGLKNYFHSINGEVEGVEPAAPPASARGDAPAGKLIHI